MSNSFQPLEHIKTAELSAVFMLQSPDPPPPVWLVVPFLLLLLMIATGPLLYHRFWEEHYSSISLWLGGVVAFYYGFIMEHGIRILLHTLEEYISFIALITALFVTSGAVSYTHLTLPTKRIV